MAAKTIPTFRTMLTISFKTYAEEESGSISIICAITTISSFKIPYRITPRMMILITAFKSSTTCLAENIFLIPLRGFSLLSLNFKGFVVTLNRVCMPVATTPIVRLITPSGKIHFARSLTVFIPSICRLPNDNSSISATAVI